MAHSLTVRSSNGPELSSLAERAARQMQTYWKIRAAKALEALEREARKMLQLEEELGAFAIQYYDAVGEAVERLSALEEQLAAYGPNPTLDAMPAVLAQRTLHASRRKELKARYRKLAKEIHPDRAMVVAGAGDQANHMHTLNASYQKGDLAGLLRLEAELILQEMAGDASVQTPQLEACLREIDRAADTYAQGYRALLHSPLNELMLRAMSARLAGWDWLAAVVARVHRCIEEKERALAMANIAAIGQWRDTVAA